MDDYSQILYVDPEDSLAKTKEQFRLSNKKKIVLVLPEENRNLKNIESLTILKKESQSLNRKLTIYSTDPYYKKIAEDCGIEVEESLLGGSFLGKKGEVGFRPQVSDIISRKEKEKEQPEIKEEKKPLPVEEKPQKEEKKPQKQTKLPKKISPAFYVFLLALVAAGVFLALTWLPKADIVIVPTSEQVDFSGRFSVVRGAEIDLENNVLPGTIFAKEKDVVKSFTVVNEQEKSEKSTGTVTIYNKDTSSHRFITGTRFESSDGKIFRSLDVISIPAGSSEEPGSVEVRIVADKAGKEYNIPPGDFTLPGLKETPLYDKISAKSTKAMKGGFVGVSKMVSQADLEAAQQEMEELQKEALEKLQKELFKDLPKNFQFLEDMVIVEKSDIVFDKKEGEIADSFKGTINLKLKVLTFKQEDIQKIISKIVASKIKEEVEFKEILETQKTQYTLLTEIKNLRKLEISFEGEEKVAWKVDEEKIKKEITGKTPAEFKKYITDESEGKIKDAQLLLWPFYVNNIPERQNRLFVEVQYK